MNLLKQVENIDKIYYLYFKKKNLQTFSTAMFRLGREYEKLSRYRSKTDKDIKKLWIERINGYKEIIIKDYEDVLNAKVLGYVTRMVDVNG